MAPQPINKYDIIDFGQVVQTHLPKHQHRFGVFSHFGRGRGPTTMRPVLVYWEPNRTRMFKTLWENVERVIPKNEHDTIFGRPI